MSAAKFTAEWLMAQTFPPVKYVVPGIVPEGMTLLVAAPKIGKSWLVLGLGLELSNGGDAFGCIPVGIARPVLYLALEDGQRRLQDRLRMLKPEQVSHRLQFIVSTDGEPVIAIIRQFMRDHAGTDPVVILDTLGKVMPPAGANQSAYAHDYSMLSALKATCDDEPGSSLVIVHHTRKQDGGDFLDAVSGTQGIAGAADTVLVLRRDRGDNRATLQVTSRDTREGEYSLILTDTGAWELDGRSLEDAARAAHTAKASVNLGEKSTDVINKIAEYPEGISPKNLKTLLPHIPAGTIDVYLKRLHDTSRIERSSRGLYSPVRTVRSESFESDLTNGSYETNTTQNALQEAQ